MIRSFKDGDTEKVFKGERVKKFSVQLSRSAQRKLRVLESSTKLQDLKVPPANHLEKLGGKYKGFYSIRINDQWRIIFTWDSGYADQIEIIDYHS